MITENQGHDGMPARHGDATVKTICEKYREYLQEIYEDIRKQVKEKEENI